jgi:serine/threonine protein kinase
MIDPVCTCDGHTFERSPIEMWLTSSDSSPLTGIKLDSRTLLQNVALRNAIDEYFGGHATESTTTHALKELELEREIGTSATKTVYEARWRGKRVAALQMKAGSCKTEASVMTQLSKHPSLIRFFGIASDGGEFEYLITEFAPMGSLCSVLEKFDEQGKEICFGVRMAVAHQICEGMEAVASEGLIHRDLACRNVLVAHVDPADPSLTDVKVCDFGLAAMGSTVYGGEGEPPVRWMSPEALQRRQWTEKSDVWAFGVTLWELFSGGCVPWADASDKEVFQCVVDGERLPKPKDCPDSVFKVLQACWQKRSDDRPTFRSLRILLRDAERDVSVEDALAARSDHKKDAKPLRHIPPTVNNKETTEKIQEGIHQMRAVPQEAKAQEDGARVLANLAGTLYGRSEIAKLGGVEVLVETMNNHLQQRYVQECAMAALSNLSAGSPENQTKIAEANGIKALLAAMRAHATKPLVQQYGATALRNLTLHNSVNKVSIAAEGGIEALIRAMFAHPKVATVQQYAADALQNIALHNAANKVEIADKGGIPALVSAMRGHKRESRVQQYCCFALANLAANNAVNARLIADAGAIPDIILAMGLHRGMPGVQRYAASALKYLAGENAANQGKIAKEQGIKALIDAMTTHRTNDAVQQYAASALKNLAANNPHNKTTIAEDGGIGILLAGMRSHRMKPLVQQHAASALQNLAGNHSENKARIAQEGGIPLIVAAMNNHPHESQVQRYAASALKNLSSDNSENKLLIARDGGIEALIAAIVHANAEAEVQQYAAGALQNIAANNAFTKAEVVRHGGVAKLEEIVTRLRAEFVSELHPASGTVADVRIALESALRVMRS